LDFLLNKKVEYYAFYNATLDYKMHIFMKRSTKNFYSYVEYLNTKNNYILKINYAKTQNYYTETVKFYDSYKDKVDKRELRIAEDDLNKANKNLPQLKNMNKQLVTIFKPFVPIQNSK